jgi:hypothetical protein
MKIAICGSLDFTEQIKTLADALEALGLEVEIPPTSRLILDGKLTLEQIKAEKAGGNFSERATKVDAIRRYWRIIQTADAILVANYDKKGVQGYVGGNTFLEMGFAHVLDKQIYLLNPIPDMMYTDEIKTMQPTVLDGDVRKVSP